VAETTNRQGSPGFRTGYKRKFGLWELYRANLYLPGAISRYAWNRKHRLLDDAFVERLQLAVTEVNGCAACSFAHTLMALKMGMGMGEISSFLNGDGRFIKPEEAKAILFAQHFADSRSNPKKEAWESIVKEYGKKEAGIILAAVQVMTVGNIYGIPFSAFQSRLKGKTYPGSTLLYELGMEIAGFILLPVALLHGTIRHLLGLPQIRLDFNREPQ
jgi:AhpD family alkylhydroperoxidase